MIDDALGWSDPQRLKTMGAAIAAAGKQCQIIVLTCTPGRYGHVGGTPKGRPTLRIRSHPPRRGRRVRPAAPTSARTLKTIAHHDHCIVRGQAPSRSPASRLGLSFSAWLRADVECLSPTVCRGCAVIVAPRWCYAPPRQGPNAGREFWGCSRWPGCTNTQPQDPSDTPDAPYEGSSPAGSRRRWRRVAWNDATLIRSGWRCLFRVGGSVVAVGAVAGCGGALSTVGWRRRPGRVWSRLSLLRCWLV